MKMKRSLEIYVLLGVLVVAFGVSFYLLHSYITSEEHYPDTMVDVIEVFNVNTPLEIYFNTKDPLALKWQHITASEQPSTNGNVILCLEVKTMEDYLTAWKTATSGKHHAWKFSFTNMTLMEKCLQHLHQESSSVNFPVIIHSDVDVDSRPLDVFLFKVKTSFPRIPISIGYPPRNDSGTIPDAYDRTLWDNIANFKQTVFITVHASSVRTVWSHVRWVLNQADNIYLLIEATPESSFDSLDVVYVTSDWVKERTYFDIPDGGIDRINVTTAKAGSPLNYFNVDEALEVTWSHAVNSQKKMEDSLNSDVMFLEADISIGTHGSSLATDTLIMAHPPSVTSDLSLKQFLNFALSSKKGIKLDFKFLEAVEPALKIISQKDAEETIKQPVWLNADILTGPNSVKQGVNASQFLATVQTIFPNVVFSVGWTTGWSRTTANSGYSQAMVEEMHNLVKNLKQPITFPIRASLARQSWQTLQWLLNQSRGYTLTIWGTFGSNGDDMSREDMEFVRRNSESHRVFYDIPQELMPR